MPRMTMTDRSIKALHGRPGTSVDYFDARLPRFAMRITEKGNKSWIILYPHGGRFRRMALGPYPAVSLADARELATATFHLVAAGRDPAIEKHTNREAPTFADLAHEYMERHVKVRKRYFILRKARGQTRFVLFLRDHRLLHSCGSTD